MSFSPQQPRTATLRFPVAGMLESIGQLDDQCLFVGGWAHDAIADGALAFAAAGGKLVSGRLHLLRSDRPDVGPGAAFRGVFEFSAPVRSEAIEAVQLASSASVGLYEGLQHLPRHSCIDLLREAAEVSPLAILTEPVARFAFEYAAKDTVNLSPLPIRIGIDDCVAMPGESLLLRGWIYDPEELVDSVTLSGAGFGRRIDQSWVGQLRPDVGHCFAADPRFSVRIAPHQHHGFVTLITGIGEKLERPHLTLSIKRGRPLHYPLQVRGGNPLALLRALVLALDPDAPGVLDAVDLQIAPALSAMRRRRPPLTSLAVREPEAPTPLTLVVGAIDRCGELPDLLVLLACDPEAAAIPVIVVAPQREMATYAGELQRRAAFLGLRLRLVGATDLDDELDALAIGVETAGSPLVCLVPGHVLPVEPEWLTHLVEEKAASGAKMIVPGFPDGGACPGCCLVDRQAFLEAGSFSGGWLDPLGKWQDFRQRLGPAAQVTSADVRVLLREYPSDVPPSHRRLMRRADAAATAIASDRAR